MKILYFGPITPKGKPNTGGYEAANRKNIDKLSELGITVKEFPNPRVPKRFGVIGKLVYLKLFLTPFLILKYVGRKDVIIHTTPLYGNLLEPSLLLLFLAKLLNIPTLLDIRAGSLIYYYNTKGIRKKFKLRLMIKLATKITVEGSSYINEIKNIMKINKDIRYFPNVAYCNKTLTPPPNYNNINLFYFGRITPNKGIDVLLDLIKELPSNYHLFLAGPIAHNIDKDLILKNRKTTYLGLLTHNELITEMGKMHFFIFPTRHVGEGQSNSLIEAMANGLVPIASNQGFNAEVVSDCGFILKQNSTGKEYADTIQKINEQLWNLLRKKCIMHINLNHNINIEIPKLIKIYKEILSNE